MGRSKPFAIDTRGFSSQSEAKAFFKRMLGQYQPGDRVADADAAHLLALLKRHDEYAEKVKGGVDHFVVDIPPDYTTKCFSIVRADGSLCTFSYLHCVDQIPR